MCVLLQGDLEFDGCMCISLTILSKYKFPTTHRDLKQHKIDVLNHNITKNLHPINNKIKIP